MEAKKNKKFDLESKRGVFFLTGLTLALLAAIYIIQIESGYYSLKPDCQFPIATINASDAIPITFAPEPEKPKAEPTVEEKKSETQKFLNDFIETQNDTEEKPTENKGAEAKVDKPVEDIRPASELDDVEVITGNIGNLSWVAVPKECAGLRTNEARKQCLNNWMITYVNKNARYPEIPKRMGDEERVYISFVIDEFGKVQEVKSVRGENQMLVNEALRVVQGMPEFEPASQGAKKARMTMTVPVSFKLH